MIPRRKIGTITYKKESASNWDSRVKTKKAFDLWFGLYPERDYYNNIKRYIPAIYYILYSRDYNRLQMSNWDLKKPDGFSCDFAYARKGKVFRIVREETVESIENIFRKLKNDDSEHYKIKLTKPTQDIIYILAMVQLHAQSVEGTL